MFVLPLTPLSTNIFYPVDDFKFKDLLRELKSNTPILEKITAHLLIYLITLFLVPTKERINY